MKQNEIRNAVPQTPAHFVRRMDETLERIENMNKTQKKAHSTLRTLLIAAVITVLLAGTALAVGKVFGIFELMTLKPLKGAEHIIQTDVGQLQSEYGSVAVEEAAYSGNGFSLLIHIQPSEGCGYNWPEISLLNAEQVEWGFYTNQWEMDDGEKKYLQTGILTGDTPEVLEGEVTVPVSIRGEVVDTLRVPFRVQHTQAERAKLVPLSEGEQWSLVSAQISFGELFATFEVRYLCDVAEDEMGVDIILFDADGNRLESGSGTGFDEEGEDGAVLHGWRTEYQSFETIPETLILRPKIIGEDSWLDPVECAVIPY